MVASLGACTTEYGGNVPSNQCESVGNDPTPGREGRVEFVWGQGLFTCLFGCTADNPMVSMGTAKLAVLGTGGLGPFVIQSADPSVIEVEHVESADLLTVFAKSPGDVELQLVSTQSGEVLDALEVKVRDVYEALTYHDLRVYRDSDAVIRLELYDDEGCRMVGTGAINYALAGDLSSENLDLDPENDIELNDSYEQLAVRGGTPASGGLAVIGPGLQDELPVRILGPDDVAEIDMSDEIRVPAGSTSFVYPYAFDDGGDEILGAHCEWTVSPPDSPIEIQDHGDSVELNSDTVTQATVTCTIGSASASMQVIYE
jgi:hypothetical protein